MDKKYIIREVEPEACDFSFYFDNDGLTERGGDYFNTLFIVPTRDYRGFNGKEYERVQEESENLIDAFAHVGNGWYDYTSYKEAMQSVGIDYSPRKCHLLKEWAKDADEREPESIAAYLTITTGKKWDVDSARGYCQGDYVEMVYCPEHYKNGVQHYGEVWLGAAKEFCTIELDENGEESMSVYGYIIADCQARTDEDYKRLVCEWAGISPDDAQLEMIDDCYTARHYKYRIA